MYNIYVIYITYIYNIYIYIYIKKGKWGDVCYMLWFSYIYGQMVKVCSMILRVMLHVVNVATYSHFDELSFPGMFCSFLFLDYAKVYYQNDNFPLPIKQDPGI